MNAIDIATEAARNNVTPELVATKEYRAYDTVTEWQGPVRDSVKAAQADADRHNEGCAAQGGYGSADVVTERDGRCVTLAGEYIWPPHGRSCGAARWR